MKFYTKEWYALMQRQHVTSGLHRIPDKVYSNREIRSFYDRDLQAEIARDRRLYDTPPSYTWAEELLRPEAFQPENFLVEDPETGELFHPQTPEIARAYLDRERRQQEAQFVRRPPFDPAETIACFQSCYRAMLRHSSAHYPQWLREAVDKRLLALNRIPESAYRRLKQEEQNDRRAFRKIERAAQTTLAAQDIPETVRAAFQFHDAHLLSLKKVRSNVEMVLRRDGGWPGDASPYFRIIFQDVCLLDREKGLTIRTRTDADGIKVSNCQYLYDELYRTGDGYEIHILLWTRKALRYLTIRCRDIGFDEPALSVQEAVRLPTEDA